MKLDLPAVDRLVDTLENADKRPVPVVAHRVVMVPDAWLALTLALIAGGLCGIAWAMLEGGQRGARK
jgi:hypothetical protein